MNIVLLGDICIDRNEVEGAKYEFLGGPITYFNLILKTFPDTDITAISNFGEDLLKYKDKIKLHTDKPNEEKTLCYRNIVKKGKRTQFAENLNEEGIQIKPDEVEQIIKSADLIIFGVITPFHKPSLIKELISKSDATKVAVPQGYFRNFNEDGKVSFREFAEAEEIVPLFDFIVLSEEDYPNLYEESAKWYEKYGTEFIITREYDGADCVGELGRFNIPTEKITDIKDSTGSGEIFTASFAYEYARTKDVQRSVEFAHRIAGACLYYTPSELGETGDYELLIMNE